MARIEINEHFVVWSEFGYDDNYEEGPLRYIQNVEN